jgi:hypothetical protein
MTMEQRTVYLGRHSELSQTTLSRTIPVEFLVTLESLSAECDMPSVRISVDLPKEGGRKSILRLAFSPLSVGAFEGTVTFKPVLKGGEALPAQRMRLIGKIVADLETDPPMVQVGARRVGQTFEEIIVLRSLSGQRLANVRTDVEGAGLTVQAVEGNDQYRVRQTVLSTGFQRSCVRFFAELAGRQVSLTLPVEFTGLNSE